MSARDWRYWERGGGSLVSGVQCPEPILASRIWERQGAREPCWGLRASPVTF